MFLSLHLLRIFLPQMKCKSLKAKITQAESLTKKVEQLSSSLPPKEKDVLQRQVLSLTSDLKLKMEQLENDRKRLEDFECRLEAVTNKLMEFEEKLNKVDENNAVFMKVSGCSKAKAPYYMLIAQERTYSRDVYFGGNAKLLL